MNVGDRIRKRRKQLKMSVDQLAEKLGKNRATVYRYESSEIENMPLEILEPLAKALNVSPAYLMGWDQTEPKQLSSNYKYFPVSISAGLPISVDGVSEDTVETISIPDSLMGKWAGNNDVFITKINGDSMNRIIPHNSLIAVKKVEPSQLKNGDIVVYSDDHEYSVKRFYKDDYRLIFKPDSNDPTFVDYVTSITNENLNIHGKVVLYIVELD